MQNWTLVAPLSLCVLGCRTAPVQEEADRTGQPTVAASVLEPEIEVASWEPFAANVRRGSSRALQQGEPAELVPPAPATSARRPVTTRSPSLRARLRTTRLSGLKLEAVESLREALEPVKAATGLPILVSREAEEAVQNAAVVFDLDFSNPISVLSILDLLTEMAGDEVAWTVKHEVVMVTTAEKARDEVVLGRYEVRTLTTPLTHFAGPKIGHVFISGDDTEGVFGSSERAEPAFSEDALVTMVEDNIAPGTWGENGTSVFVHNGLLFVRHTPEVQRKVRELLAQLGSS